MTHDYETQIVLDTAAELEKPAPGAQAAPAGKFRAGLGTIIQWLRASGVTIPAILAKLPAILAALQGGDWLTIVQTLISLFHLPPATSAPAAPA